MNKSSAFVHTTVEYIQPDIYNQYRLEAIYYIKEWLHKNFSQTRTPYM